MDDVTFITDGLAPVARIVVVTTVAYLALVLLVRGSGQRTLATMTPFDFILAVTIGSAFGRVVTAQEVGVLDAIVAFVVLVGLQWIVIALRARFPRFARLVNARPSVIFHDGQFQRAAMRRHRLTEQDVLVNARQQGLGSLEGVHTILLEPDGKFAIITPAKLGDGSTLERLNET